MKSKKLFYRSAFVFATLLSLSCQKEQKKRMYPLQSQIIGLASPISLEFDSTIVFLEDYFLNPDLIDSISTPAELLSKKDGQMLYLKGNIENPLDYIQCHIGLYNYHILIKQSNKINFTFTYKPKKSISFKTLAYSGSLNGWTGSKNVLNPDDKGNYSTSFLLSPGEYPYKIEIDGIKHSDFNNPDSASNGSGGFNSIMKVGNLKHEKNLMVFESFEQNKITISAQKNMSKAFVFWDNYLIESNLKENSLYFEIPKEAQEIERSHIRVFACSENAASNDLLIPLQNGKPISDTKNLKRDDKQTFIMYFMMVDRFYNGDQSNDMPLRRPDVHPKADYFGGDLKGIIDKIEDGYFTNLGVNTIWLSPITQNPLGPWGKYPNPETSFSGYHGYWPISSSKVDFRFGDEKTLSHLVAKSHDNNFNVLLDYVANHVHMEHPAIVNNPDWATPLYLPDGTMNTEKWDEHRLTTWFDTFLATLDFSKPEVLEAMTDSALFWFKNYKIDGFRHDATKHIDLPFWRMLTKKLKTQVIKPTGRNLYQIGETYGNPELINSYVNSGMLDAQFDFNLYDAAVEAFANEDASLLVLKKTLESSLNTYGYHHLMGNISGNQDRARFISYADESVKFDEDAKLAGWTREINVQDTLAYKKLALLQAFNFTIPGIPVIYYGDEYGMPGGNDPDNRRQMQFENLLPQEEKLRTEVSNLAKKRSNSMALLYGNVEFIKASDDFLVFTRSYNQEKILVAINKSKTEIKFNLPASKETITLKPISYEIINL